MIVRSRVQVPAGAAGEVSSPVSTFCALQCELSISVSVPLPCYRSNAAKHAGTLRVRLCMVVMVYTELAPRRQQFHVALAMQEPNSAVNTLLG